MPIVQDVPLIAKQIETFFNSPATNATISVVLLNPINNVLNLNITKTSTTTLQELVNNVISRITLYLKNSSQSIITKNNVTITQTFNSAQSKNEYNNFIKQYFFQRYLASNSLSGRLRIN